MSFIITMYVREGIVMASDSRLTLNAEKKDKQKKIVQMAVGMSDSNYKTFNAPNNVGISTFGQAEIGGIPIAGYIETFIIEKLKRDDLDVDDVAKDLLDYFQQFDPSPSTQFHVAGYKNINGENDQQVWNVDVKKNEVKRVNPPGQQGASWGGEGDILARLLQPVGVIDQKGNVTSKLPHHKVPWQFFTLQDAIDFCIFAVRSTIDAIRFQPRPKTVGGPIDVLVLKPGESNWIQRKELHP